MKTVKLLSLAIASTIFLNSCSKKLDLKPQTSVDADVAKSDPALLLIGAYSLMGSGGITNSQEGALYGTDVLLAADLLASEDYMTWRGTFNSYNEISNKTISVTNTSIIRMWRKAYSAINLSNVLLESAGKLSATDAQYYAAQAKFVRGCMYFELLKFYGEASTNRGVPIITSATNDYESITFPSRNSISETYTQIISDLTEAYNNLGDDHGDYANKYTAAAMLARMYLYKGEYDKALSFSNEVITSEKYSLPSSPDKSFNTSGASDHIFAISQTTQNNTGTTNDGLTTFYGCDQTIPGSAGRGDVNIDSTFIKLYEETDIRRSQLVYEGSCNKASVTSSKWKNPYTNIPVIRLAEMYLTRAECNLRLSSTTGAEPLADINLLREKAGASVYADIDLDKILLERQLELAFEGHRIHDFKRLKTLFTLVDNSTIDYSGDEFVFPIPLSEINVNKNITQNSYYQ